MQELGLRWCYLYASLSVCVFVCPVLYSRATPRLFYTSLLWSFIDFGVQRRCKDFAINKLCSMNLGHTNQTVAGDDFLKVFFAPSISPFRPAADVRMHGLQ